VFSFSFKTYIVLGPQVNTFSKKIEDNRAKAVFTNKFSRKKFVHPSPKTRFSGFG